MKRRLVALALIAAATPAHANLFGWTFGATAGGTEIRYQGRDDYGLELGVNANYQFNPILSMNIGYAYGSAEVDSRLSSAVNDIEYNTFPLTLQAEIPLVIGDVYAKAGTNYHDVDIDNPAFNIDYDGWGFTGGVGVNFTLLPFVDLSLGYEYRDMGRVENNVILLGIGLDL